ncbi:uncharacterized protein [Drosophila bipectinata]|uniref:uncharacterized protein n=1 Tax=Drosophila bipectinata TaxID=42026 RepID=UPI001C893E40|nr:uncharacterized protein LOC108130148 [Drosophila bipectinata]
MQEIFARKVAICAVVIVILASISAEEVGQNGGVSDTKLLSFWEKILNAVKNYPWQSNSIEKESPETAHKKSVLWQRLTMATVL